METMNMTYSAATQCNCNKTHCNLHNANHEHAQQRCNTVQLQQNTLQLTKWSTNPTATYKMEAMNMNDSAATQCNCNKTHCNLHNGNHEHDLQRCSTVQLQQNTLQFTNHEHAQQRCNTVQLQQNTLQLTQWKP